MPLKERHCRRFCRVNDILWEPEDRYDIVPPKETLTNENLEDFLTDVFEHTAGKPSVKQAKKWINHALAKYKLPPLNPSHCGNKQESRTSTMPACSIF